MARSLRLNRSLLRRFAPPSLLVVCVVIGCSTSPPPLPSTAPVHLATDIDPATTQPSYWIDQPGVVDITSSDFQSLWSACESMLKHAQFKIDRQDYRNGLLTSLPVISKQFYEFWRDDAPTGNDIAESSLAEIRRTILFQFTRNSEGNWTVVPKVLVERFAIIEPKLRTTLQYQPYYWYPLRRDELMERHVAKRVEKELRMATANAK